MEIAAKKSFISSIATYWKLAKPGIIMGNAITAIGGFSLASKGNLDLSLFFASLLGLCLVVASGCVLNNYIDRKADEKMERTKNRPLVKGQISKYGALVYASILLVTGSLVLGLFVNNLALILSLLGFIVYVIFYSFSKYFSIYGTLIGSIAGAVPPVVGYLAVNPKLDLAALLLFAIVVMWQMPHFYAIAIYRYKEYAAASIPLLPIKKGVFITKIHMLFYNIAFIAACSLLYVFNYAGSLYLIVSLTLGILWLALCIRGFKAKSDTRWARKMFVFSLIVIMGVCAVLPFSVS